MKRILCLLVLCACVTGSFAQDVYYSSGSAKGYKHKKTQKGYDPSKLIIGATLNASYSGDYANFGIGPTVGYKFTEAFSAGVGLGYQFNQIPDFYALPNPNTGNYPPLKENLIYPGIWAKYNVYHNVFVDANFEYDFINVKGHRVAYDSSGGYNVDAKFKTNVPCLLLGVGLKQPLGGRVSGFLEILYDVLQENYSPYYRQFPIIRAGITTGL